MGSNRWVLVFLLVLFFYVGSGHGFAQTFGEFFNQKKTQKRYLLEQIAALQVYGGYLKKGYEIVGSGVAVVRELSAGEFGLHSAFFASLKAVNPFIRNHAQVAEIIGMQVQIIRCFSGRDEGDLLSDTQRSYVDGVRLRVLSDCVSDLEGLLMLVSSGRVEMSDAERLERLDRLYVSMQDKLLFSKSFSADVEVLIRQKAESNREFNQILNLYEIH